VSRGSYWEPEISALLRHELDKHGTLIQSHMVRNEAIRASRGEATYTLPKSHADLGPAAGARRRCDRAPAGWR